MLLDLGAQPGSGSLGAAPSPRDARGVQRCGVRPPHPDPSGVPSRELGGGLVPGAYPSGRADTPRGHAVRRGVQGCCRAGGLAGRASGCDGSFGGVSAAHRGLGGTGAGQMGKVLWSAGTCFWLDPLVLVPSWRGKTLGDPQKSPGSCHCSSLSPGRPRPVPWAREGPRGLAAGATRGCPRGTPGTVPGRFRHRSNPVVGKTHPVLSKQLGTGQCLTAVPRPAALPDTGTWGHRHGPSEVTCPSSVPPTWLWARSWGQAARACGTPGNPIVGWPCAGNGWGHGGAWGPGGWPRRWPSLSWGSGRDDPSLRVGAQRCCIPEPGGYTGDSLVPSTKPGVGSGAAGGTP